MFTNRSVIGRRIGSFSTHATGIRFLKRAVIYTCLSISNLVRSHDCTRKRTSDTKTLLEIATPRTPRLLSSSKLALFSVDEASANCST